MNRWALAVLAIAVVGCQQTQPAGSPFAAFQPTRLTGPATGSYGMAKNGTMSASAAGAPGGSTVPPGFSNGVPTSSPPAVTPTSPAATTPTVGGGLGGSSAVPPTLPPSGNDAYYNPGTSSTMSGAGAAGLAAQPLPAGAPLAGVSPSGSFGVGGSFASPGTGFGSPVAGFAPQGAVATVGYDQPLAGSNQPVALAGQPTYYGATANAARAGASGVVPAGYGQPTYGQPYGQSPSDAAATRPSLPSVSGTPSTWNGGASTTSSSGTMQWRSR